VAPHISRQAFTLEDMSAGKADLLLDIRRSHHLRFQHCTECGYRRFPVARFCPQCLSPDWSWAQDSGLGSVWSFAVYHRCFHPAFAAAIPYNVALVELDSGPRLITNVLAAGAGQLRIGLRVRAVPRMVRPGQYVLYAEPSEDEETP